MTEDSKQPVQEHDATFQALTEILQSPHGTSLKQCVVNPYVKAVTRKWSSSSTSDSQVVQLYTFATKFRNIWGNHPRYLGPTVPVRVTSASQTSVDSFEVHYSAQWIPLRKFLADYPLSPQLEILYKESTTGRRGYYALFDWWKNNGKTFHFMDLPSELRRQIYIQTLGPTIYPYPVNTHKPLPAERKPAAWMTNGVPEYRPGRGVKRIPMLYWNRQVKSEAESAGWEGTMKCFVNLSWFPRPDDYIRYWPTNLHAYATLADFKCLNRVQLQFLDREYLELFGVDVGYTIGTPWELRHKQRQLAFVDIFRSIQYLELDIRFEARVCFRTAVADWILTVGKPYLDVVGRIEILDTFPPQAKEKWEDIFAYQKRHGCIIDMSDDITAIFEDVRAPRLG